MPTFPAWRPDAYSLGTGFARDVSGVLPGTGGWVPWPALEALGSAVAAAVRGAFIARDSTGAPVIFAGTATALYKWAGIGSPWTDVTRTVGGAYAVPTEGEWDWAQFGDTVIAVNGADAPQYYTLASSTDFDALGGSPPSAAKRVQVVGDHVWLMDFTTALGPSGIMPNGRAQIAWSGFRDPDYWTLGSKSCSFATFPTGGFVQAATTQLAGIVFLERGIWRFGKDAIKIFAFDPILEGQGTSAPYSVIQHEDSAIFYGTDGFAKIGGAGFAQIGSEWIDNWALENFNQTRLKQVIGALDPVRMRCFWIYPNPGNSASYTHNGIVCFDMLNTEKPWSKADIECEYIFSGATPGATLADLTTLYTTLAGVQSAGFTMGSDAFLGGAPRIAAFDSLHKMAFFSGNGVEAMAQTAEFMPIPGRRFYTNGFRAVTDASTATGRVAVAEAPHGDLMWKSSAGVTAQGFIPARASGKILVNEVTIPEGEEWTFLSGVDHMQGDIVPDGVR
jgi:hypothetical protein